jgi:hypothetical protein
MVSSPLVSARPVVGRRWYAASVIRAPFTADTWRRTLYTVIAGPLAVVSAPLALIGGPAGKLQRRVARKLLSLDVAEPARTGPRSLLHALLALPLSLPIVVIVGYGWSLAVLNLAYPLRPLVGLGTGGEGAWGGPSLAGAWAFHGLFGGVRPWRWSKWRTS